MPDPQTQPAAASDPGPLRLDPAAELAALWEQMPVGVYSVAPDGGDLRANRALRRMLGDAAALPPWPEAFRRRLMAEGRVTDFLRPWPAAAGAPDWVAESAWLLRDPSGGAVAIGGTVVDATLIAAPSSTKNQDGERDPEMHQTKKGNQWHFGMKCHIGIDADSGLVHTVVGTAANVNDVTQAGALVHGEETDVFADAGYQGVTKREEVQGIEANWHVAMRPGKRRALDKDSPMGAVLDQLEHIKARIRAKVEHPFRVIKRQFGHVKVRYRGLAKNTAQLHTLFALSNLWMARRRLLQGLQA